jgi:predicted ATPase
MDEQAHQVLGNRYQLVDTLGTGGMGIVYRAVDRLNRQPVALKRVMPPAENIDLRTDDSLSVRLALAHEFQTLASLRHPNIISVLDYGFDDDKQPYFTMSLLEEPQSITRAAAGKPLEYKIRLLIEMLQALVYLHRRGVIHRDLKPDNALVTGSGELKVLDFGLAVLREQIRGDEGISGTLAYLAPEVLQDEPASEASDLYAVGVIAYELFAGHHPFTHHEPDKILYNILLMPADIDALDVSQDLAHIVQRLLEKSPVDRYREVNEVLKAVITAVDHPIPGETAAIRESFLQAARFVGRERELGLLSDALVQAMEGKGSAWLIGGESGVGKSRLLDELRTRALIRGAVVLHGQAVAGGGLTYQLWRDPLRRLALSTPLSAMEASILKQILPDIGELLGQKVADPPDLEGSAGQQRLLHTIVSVFQKQHKPVMLVVEDLEWSIESLEVLKLLLPVIATMPLLVVGSYRDDERPDLPQILPEMEVIRLERLTDEGIIELSESMLGDAGRQPEVVNLLKQETEGNVFFLVEVVRTLAEEAGSLSDIGRTSLPQRVLAGGVQTVVQRRLNRVPAEARSLLDVAAIIGRQLDLKLLQTIAPQTKLDEWLTTCSNAAVVEIMDEQWRFAHEKLREGLLAALPPDERRDGHKQVAAALQSLYPETDNEYAGFIANHLEEAGELAQAIVWYIHAGKYAQTTYAPEAAINCYRKVLAFWEQGIAERESERVRVYEGLGKMLNWQASYAQALEAFQGMQAAAEAQNDTAALSRAWYNIAESQLREGDIRAALESATRAEEYARSAEGKYELARALWMKGWAMFRLGDPQMALTLGEEVLAISTEIGHQEQMGHSANLIGAAHYAMGNYAQTEQHFEQAMERFQTIGERGSAMALLNNLGVLAAARGDYQTALTRYQDALAMAHELGHRDAEMVYLTNLGGAQVGLGEHDDAEISLQQVIDTVGDADMGELSETYRFLAEAYLGQERLPEAQVAAQQALTLGRQIGSPEYIAGAWRVLGQTAAHLSNAVDIEDEGEIRACDADACFSESVRICQETGMEGERARTLSAWAKCKLAQGDEAAAAEMWRDAREIFTQVGAHHEVERMADLPAKGQ